MARGSPAQGGRVEALRGRWRRLVAHFLDMEGVTGSNPVRPTTTYWKYFTGSESLPLVSPVWQERQDPSSIADSWER